MDITLFYQIGFNGRRAACNKHQRTQQFFRSLTAAILVVTALYPIILAVSPLAHRINIDAEVVAWAIQDILSQGIFGFWLLLTLDNSEAIVVYVDGYWAFGLGNEGSIRVSDQHEGA